MPKPVRPKSDGLASQLLAVAAAGAGPDEAVALAFLVDEEVGVDRSGEARIVQLEPEIVATLGGALGSVDWGRRAAWREWRGASSMVYGATISMYRRSYPAQLSAGEKGPPRTKSYREAFGTLSCQTPKCRI